MATTSPPIPGFSVVDNNNGVPLKALTAVGDQIQFRTQAEISSPSAADIANTAATFILSTAPFTRYVTNGTSLVAGGGGLSITNSHIFANSSARDTYFTANPAEKTTGVFIAVGAGFQLWNGTSWVDSTAVVQGPAGPAGSGGYPITATTYNGSGQLTNYTSNANAHTITYTTVNGTSVPSTDVGGGVTRTFHWKNTTPPQFDYES